MIVEGTAEDILKLVRILHSQALAAQIRDRLEKSLRRYPDAQITDRKPIGAPDSFLAEIKRGRKSTVFCLSQQEIAQAADKLDELINARLTTTMLRN